MAAFMMLLAVMMFMMRSLRAENRVEWEKMMVGLIKWKDFVGVWNQRSGREKRTGELRNGRIDERTKGGMDERTNGLTNKRTNR